MFLNADEFNSLLTKRKPNFRLPYLNELGCFIIEIEASEKDTGLGENDKTIFTQKWELLETAEDRYTEELFFDFEYQSPVQPPIAIVNSRYYHEASLQVPVEPVLELIAQLIKNNPATFLQERLSKYPMEFFWKWTVNRSKQLADE